MSGLELHVWERIDNPNKSVEDWLKDVEEILEHIDEKIPFGIWSREVEVKGCWLDVQESLEHMDKERIQYKLETYYGTKSIEEAMEKERATPATEKTIEEKINSVEIILNNLEEKMPKDSGSRESECYECWLYIKDKLEAFKLTGDKECLDHIECQLEKHYETKDMEAALKHEWLTPAPETKNKNKGIGLDD